MPYNRVEGHFDLHTTDFCRALTSLPVEPVGGYVGLQYPVPGSDSYSRVSLTDQDYIDARVGRGACVTFTVNDQNELGIGEKEKTVSFLFGEEVRLATLGRALGLRPEMAVFNFGKKRGGRGLSYLKGVFLPTFMDQGYHPRAANIIIARLYNNSDGQLLDDATIRIENHPTMGSRPRLYYNLGTSLEGDQRQALIDWIDDLQP